MANNPAETFVKEIVLGFGFMSGIFAYIGIDPQIEILKAVADVAELGVGKKARVVKLQVLHAWLDVIVDLGIHKLFSFAHFTQFVHPLCFHLDKRVWHRVQVRAELQEIGKGGKECRKTGVRMTSSEFRVCLNTSTFKL